MDTSSSKPMAVLLSSPYLAAITLISSLITARSFFSSARIAFNSAIFAWSSLYSFSSFSRSRPVRARSLISTIAWDWASESPKRSINCALASATLALLRIIRITSSIWSRAISRPSNMWARSSALFKSYCVRLLTTSFWWEMYTSSIWCRFKIFGWLLTRASMITPKVSCSCVCLRSWFKITLAFTSRRSSILIRIPSRLDSSPI